MKASQKDQNTASQTCCDAPDRDAVIAEIAFYKALNRDFEPGHDVEDWLEAEQEWFVLTGEQPRDSQNT